MLKLLKCVLVAGGIALAWGVVGDDVKASEHAGVTVEDLEDLVATIEDDAERKLLVGRLNALIEIKKAEKEAQEPEQQTVGSIVIDQLSAHSAALAKQLSSLTEAVLALPAGLTNLRLGLSDSTTVKRWTVGVLTLLAVIAAGLITQSVAKKFLVKPLSSIAWRDGDSLLMQFPLLVARLILILIPPATFAAVGGLLISLLGEDGIARPVALSVIYAVAFVGAINAIARTILAPAAASARPIRLGDETAHYLYIWIKRVSAVGVFGYFTIQIAGYLGLAGSAQLLLFKLVGLLLLLLFVMLILQNRRGVAQIISGKEDARLFQLRRRLADLWHVLAVLYLVVVYLVWAVGMPGGFAYVSSATLLTALAVFLGIAAASFAVRMIDRAFSLSDELKARLPGLEARTNRYLPIVKSVLRGLIAAIATLAVLQAWGLDILQWLGQAEGRALVSRLASIGAIVLLAIIGWEILSAGIERYLASNDASQSQRARTLLPLIRKVILAALSVIVGLTILSELGINIAPLLAGAGVVGLAIGFGAQTLVRDIITGLFILIEDSISVNDYVTMGGHSGTVEALSIRTIRLRDRSGTVHTIPFSDVTAVINFTRDFAYSVLEIGVAYKEDVDRVARVIEKVGQELRQDPAWKNDIVQDLEVLGLDRFDDSAVVIRARIKTAPGRQWDIRRAFNLLLKRRFDAENIEIPFPQRTVWFAEAPGGGDAVRLEEETATADKNKLANAPLGGDTGGKT